MAAIESAHNKKQKNDGALANLPRTAIGAKVMLTVNLDIHDCLIKDQIGYVSYNELAQGSVVFKKNTRIVF